MKRLLTIFTLLTITLTPVAAISTPVFAVDIFNNCGVRSNSSNTTGGTPDVCKDTSSGASSTTNPIVGAIKLAIEILSIMIGIAAIIGIIVSGLRFAMAGGDSNAIASARSTLIYSLVGVAVAILAQTIVVFVLDKLD